MFEVIRKQNFTDFVYLLEIKHPGIAANAHPGQYIDIILNPDVAPITLPIVNHNPESGTVSVVHRAQDLPSEQLMMLQEGDSIFKVKGPLGGACSFDTINKVVLVGEGLGVASIYARARRYREMGTYTICVLGFDTRDSIFWANEFSEVCDELYIATEDGSFGVSGKVTDPLRAICDTHKDVDLIIVIGELKNMRRSAKLALDHEVAARISFDAIRTPVGSPSIFDGAQKSQGSFDFARAAEIDAGDIEFDKLIARQRAINEG